MNPWDIASFDFPLTRDSVVIELGGYNGRWCGEIARRYNPRLFVYEPQEWAYAGLLDVLAGYNTQVFNYGLGVRSCWLPMGEYGTDGCSFLPAGREQGVGELREWYRELKIRGITNIDLLLLNIEGYEFVLLPYILPMISRIKWLMVQFHCVGDEKRTREYHALWYQMSLTHSIRFDYGTTLVCWQRKQNNVS